jgi:hypothetical protein
VQISRGKKHMTSNIVLGVLILKIGTSAWRQREVLLSLTMFV